jgi:hypothetical protein
MKNSQITLEHALYGLALVIATGLRFLKLADLPLSDSEAGWALQALHVAQGLRPALGPNPAYVHLTSVFFYIFGGTDFLARFWPALAGSALVLVPFFFRDRLGRLPALILAYGLAFDPGLNALSRQAGGSMLALAFVLLAWAMWKEGRRALAGTFAGLALLSGSSVWFGLLGLLLAWAFGRGLARRASSQPAEETVADVDTAAAPARLDWGTLRTPLVWGLGTLLVVGSLLLRSPRGMMAFLDSLPAFLRNLWILSDVPVRDVLLALPAYELMPLIFGLVAAVRGILKRDALSLRVSLWVLVTLVLVLIYPGKQVADLGWTLLPLWVLAALELGRHLDFEGRNAWQLAAVITLTVVLLVFAWLTLAQLTTLDLAAETTRPRLFLVLAVFLLVGLSLLLVGAGWSADLARLGGVWGGMLVLTAFTLAMLTGATGLRQPLTEELWQPEARIASADLILETANQISDWNRGAIADLPLVISGVDSAALRWTFRDWQVQDMPVLSPADTPALVVTPAGTEVSLAKDYRGEGFAWHATTEWYRVTPAEWLRWFIYRQLPVQQDQIILWARGDLMIANQDQPATP